MSEKDIGAPWHVGDYDPRVVFDASGNEVVTVHGHFDNTIKKARLIAAAPDLLMACEKLADYRRRVGPISFQLEKADDYIRMIEKAIATAKGDI